VTRVLLDTTVVLDFLLDRAPDRDALLSALALPVKDYEDAVQVVSAQAELLDALITRDPDDCKGVQFPRSSHRLISSSN
jgi:hypothetical protein